MRLTLVRIVVLVASTLVLSILGSALMVMGVHGPQIATIVGAVLLLPSVILVRLGVPVGIPFITSTKVVAILIWLGLQTAYYYGWLQLVYRGIRRSSRTRAD